MLQLTFEKGQNYMQTNDWRGLQKITTICLILLYIWVDKFYYLIAVLAVNKKPGCRSGFCYSNL